MNPDGEIILIDKPADMSSFGVVARVRRVLSQREGKKVKVGHTGTLDPFATGLMIILAGKATKRSNEFLKKDKVYEATVMLGKTSTTGDPEGEITENAVESIPSREDVERAVQKFTGKIMQKVPAFSAVKINGERAYKLARKGQEVATPTREVEIYETKILDYNYPELKIRTHVSSGTYIRTLGEDIGTELGTGAYLTALRRTCTGDYDVKDATTLDQFMASNS
jgi:tRNA pseudouridine55 synthase